MTTFTYKGYTIKKDVTGWYSFHTGRYGELKSKTLKGIKKLADHAAKAPIY